MTTHIAFGKTATASDRQILDHAVRTINDLDQCIVEIAQALGCAPDNEAILAKIENLRAALTKAELILQRNLGHQTEKCYDALSIIREALTGIKTGDVA